QLICLTSTKYVHIFNWRKGHFDRLAFPTRRSSDLRFHRLVRHPPGQGEPLGRPAKPPRGCGAQPPGPGVARPPAGGHRPRERRRSEEHTSELQSREKLVCRLLLEKKKGKKSLASEA